MMDHVGYAVSDLTRSKAFFSRALAPLAITLTMEVSAEETGAGGHAGFGAHGKPSFWISDGKPASAGLHIAFAAQDRATVDAFYAAALDAGGQDNGPPGVRTAYHPNYYAAFVLDPDGNNIEAVCHAPA